MIGVAEHNLGADLFDVSVKRCLDATLRTDRHERWRVDDAVRSVDLAKAGRSVSRAPRKTERSFQDTLIIRWVQWVQGVPAVPKVPEPSALSEPPGPTEPCAN